MILRPAPALCLILGLVFAVYAPSLANGFAMDDRLVAMGDLDAGRPNTMIVELRPIGDYFAAHYWKGTQSASELYRPVTVLSYALRHHFFGDFPLPAHLANISLHLLGVLLSFWMLRRLGAKLFAATLGSAAFGLHAIHSEVVSAVVGRAELLAFVFGATALVLWEGSRRTPLPARLMRGGAAALLLFLAMGSKETALVWPAFFLVFAAATHWHERRAGMTWGELARAALDVFAVSAIPLVLFLILRARMLDGLPEAAPAIGHLVNQIADSPAVTRWSTALSVWGYGLLLTLFPFHLAADYSSYTFQTIEGLFDLRSLGVLLLFLLILGAAIRRRVRSPGLFVAVACFFGFSFVTSNVPFAIGTIFGERLYYTPSLAIAFLVAWLWQRSSGHALAERLLLFLLGAWLATCATVLCARHPVWADDASLFLHELDNQPGSVRMLLTGSRKLGARGATTLAVETLEQASSIDPENALVWNNLAARHLDARRPELAEKCARRGLEAKHFQGDEDKYKLHCNLGLILFSMSKTEAAIEQMALTLRHNPQFVRAFTELNSWHKQGHITADEIRSLLADVERERPASQPYMQTYRGLLALRDGRRGAGRQLINAALIALPAHEDAVQWTHEVAVQALALGADTVSVPLFQHCLSRRPYDLASFHGLSGSVENGSLPVAELLRWLDGQPEEPTFDLYRAVLLYQQAVKQREEALFRQARAKLETVLPRLPRWRHGGRLVAEARTSLAMACRVLGDEKTAIVHLLTLAADPAMPAFRRRQARELLR